MVYCMSVDTHNGEVHVGFTVACLPLGNRIAILGHYASRPKDLHVGRLKSVTAGIE